MAEADLAYLLSVLDPHATFVLLPRAEYVKRASAWGLPPLGGSDTLPP